MPFFIIFLLVQKQLVVSRLMHVKEMNENVFMSMKKVEQ